MMLWAVPFLLSPSASAGELQQALACPAEAVERAWAAKRDGVVAEFNELGADFVLIHDVVVSVGPCDSRLVLAYTSVADALIEKQLAQKLPGLFTDVEECAACAGSTAASGTPSTAAGAPAASSGASTLVVTTDCPRPDARMVWDRLEAQLKPAFAEHGIQLQETRVDAHGPKDCQSQLTFTYGGDRNAKVDELLQGVGGAMDELSVCVVKHKRCHGLQPNGTPLGLEWRCDRYYLRDRHPYAKGYRTQAFCAFPHYRDTQVSQAVGGAMCSDDIGQYRSFGSYGSCSQGIECRKTDTPCSTPGRPIGEMRMGRR